MLSSFLFSGWQPARLNEDVHQNHPASADSVNAATLYVFSGSDWCSNCLNFKKKVLSNGSFLKSLDAHKLKLEIIDFPQRTKQAPEIVKFNREVSERFGFDGTFPTLVLYSGQTKHFKTFHYQNETPETLFNYLLNELNHLNE